MKYLIKAIPDSNLKQWVNQWCWLYHDCFVHLYESFPLDSRSTTFLTFYCKVLQRYGKKNDCVIGVSNFNGVSFEDVFSEEQKKQIWQPNSFGDLWPSLNGEKKILRIFYLHFIQNKVIHVLEGHKENTERFLIFGVKYSLKCNVGYLFAATLSPNVNWREISVKFILCPFITGLNSVICC